MYVLGQLAIPGEQNFEEEEEPFQEWQVAPSIESLYKDRQVAIPETTLTEPQSLEWQVAIPETASLKEPQDTDGQATTSDAQPQEWQVAISETIVALGHCSTKFEGLYNTPHGMHIGAVLDRAGNVWCEKCAPQCELMNTGYESNYPAVGSLKAGSDAWLKFARTRGYSEVQDMLDEFQQNASKSGKKGWK